MLSSDDDEFKKHSQLIYESFGLQLSNSYSSYGLATYDFNDIDKLAKTGATPDIIYYTIGGLMLVFGMGVYKRKKK